jgi:hypothetical protein
LKAIRRTTSSGLNMPVDGHCEVGAPGGVCNAMAPSDAEVLVFAGIDLNADISSYTYFRVTPLAPVFLGLAIDTVFWGLVLYGVLWIMRRRFGGQRHAPAAHTPTT